MSSKKRFCVVGLGNPGPKYEGTRHNIGFEWIESILNSKEFSNAQKLTEKFQSLWCRADWQDHEVHFLLPQTYMNESGKAVSEWKQKFQGESEILVAFDDMDIPLGRLRYRAEGSDGGHRGLRSIIEHLGTQEVPRLRIGIGRPVDQSIDHVLSRFTPDEKKILKPLLAEASEQLKIWLTEKTELCMNKLNAKDFRPKTEQE